MASFPLCPPLRTRSRSCTHRPAPICAQGHCRCLVPRLRRKKGLCPAGCATQGRRDRPPWTCTHGGYHLCRPEGRTWETGPRRMFRVDSGTGRLEQLLGAQGRTQVRGVAWYPQGGLLGGWVGGWWGVWPHTFGRLGAPIADTLPLVKRPVRLRQRRKPRSVLAPKASRSRCSPKRPHPIRRLDSLLRVVGTQRTFRPRRTLRVPWCGRDNTSP